jgi:hypothetical protein
LLSGDRHAAVSNVADTLGIDRFEAQLTPQQKLQRVRQLAGSGPGVAMVGDGINDAPALAAATVGIAIGTGADVAREAADICLVGRSPRLVGEAVRVSRASRRIMQQNLFWAFVYNAVMIPIAMLTAIPPGARQVRHQPGRQRFDVSHWSSSRPENNQTERTLAAGHLLRSRAVQPGTDSQLPRRLACGIMPTAAASLRHTISLKARS